MNPHLTAPELATRLHTAQQTLAHWRNKRIGPPYLKFGRRVLYPVAAVEDWEQKQMVATS